MQPLYPTLDLRKVHVKGWTMLNSLLDPGGRAAGMVVAGEIFVVDKFLPDLFTTYTGLILLAHELQHVVQSVEYFTPVVADLVYALEMCFVGYGNMWQEAEANRKQWEVFDHFLEYGWPI